jgi:hypothetical protein
MSIIVVVIEVCADFIIYSEFITYLAGACSAIAAMSLKGVEMVSIHDDIIDGDVYLKSVEEKVLPLINPWP